MTEPERNARYLKLLGEFPHPTQFTAKEAFERMPELGYTQNAYGFAKSAVNRGLAEMIDSGIFRFKVSAADQLESILEQGATPLVDVDDAPAPEAPPSPAVGTVTETVPQPTPQPQPDRPGIPVATSVTARTKEQVRTNKVTPAEASDPVSAAASTTKPVIQGQAPVAPAAAPTGRRSDDQLDTLMDLVDRYAANRFYRLKDVIVPLREFWHAVYGDAEIPAGEPPVCVVAEAYEPDSKVPNAPDIDVIFLDAKGQAHLRSAASWWFMPYRQR